MSGDRARAGFQAVERLVAVVDGVRATQPASLAQVARAAGLTEPTTLRYLTALRDHRVVRRDPATGLYGLGVRLQEWGAAAAGAYDPVEAAAPLLEGLVEEHGETAELVGVEAGDRLVVLDARQGTHGISRAVRVGDEEPWHTTAVGKSLLAALPPERAERLLRSLDLSALTERSLTEPAAVRRDLETTRRRGFALDDEESELGLRCVGVAVRDGAGHPAYAISVSGPSYRVTEDRIDGIARSLRRAADELESAWGLSPSTHPSDPEPHA